MVKDVRPYNIGFIAQLAAEVSIGQAYTLFECYQGNKVQSFVNLY